MGTWNTLEGLVFAHPLADKFDPPLEHVERTFADATKLPRCDQMVLHAFVRDRPHKFFEREAFLSASALFSQVTATHAASMQNSLVDEVTEALRFLRTSNGTARDPTSEFDRHDERRIHRLHTEVFAEYARLSEHVFGSLLALLVDLDAKVAGRTCTVPAELRSRWEMARSKRSTLRAGLTDAYNPTVRNSIVHGGVTIDDLNVVFEDASGTKEQLRVDVAERLSTRILDACNGIYAALVQSLAKGMPIASRFESWACAERAVAFARAPLFIPEAVYATDTANGTRAELHGVHRHWRLDHLLIDAARAFLVLKIIYPSARWYHVACRSPEGAPCFLHVPADRVPMLDAADSALTDLVGTLVDGEHGMLWLEQHRLVPALLGRTFFGPWLNWVDALDRGLGPIDYELRELRNISVGWRARFECRIVSAPRPEDLDQDARPTVGYLREIFTQTFVRWALRPWGRRALGTKRFRVFNLAVIHVFNSDRRISALGGLDENLLFKVQVGSRTGPALFGSHWEQVGVFSIAMNVAGHELLRKIKRDAAQLGC
jgi:hypothetical protein